jgi:predicted nucleic acid-binding protein
VRIRGQSGWVKNDPEDDKFVDTAIVAGANVIVSGDRHLLALGCVEGIEIVTARQFLQRIVNE